MKSVQNRVISGLHFPVFSLNTGKHRSEITPYLDTFHAVGIWGMNNYFLKNTSSVLWISNLTVIKPLKMLKIAEIAYCRGWWDEEKIVSLENPSKNMFRPIHKIKKKFLCLCSTLRFFWKFLISWDTKS